MDARPLGFPWVTFDPFLFCVHHDDAYPEGNELLGPRASLAGRAIGEDFAGKDGWRMYHGQAVPGFPQHPHRGFETVTLVRRGYVNHSDSLGATARYGVGDAQWLTAGAGIVHSEMFPLLERDRDNPLELFQIWLNLPRAEKMAPPYFAMLWAGDIPRRRFEGGEVTLVAGALDGVTPPAPPPHSWASRPESNLAIWALRLDPGATWTVPPARAGSNRTLYFFAGRTVTIDGEAQASHAAIRVPADRPTRLEAGPEPVELLLLQGRPIGEPVVQYGPFVMNSRSEIADAFGDYQRTQFGGWPWPNDEPVHPQDAGRFARFPDGHEERPQASGPRPQAPDPDPET